MSSANPAKKKLTRSVSRNISPRKSGDVYCKRFTTQDKRNLLHLTKPQVADHIIRQAINVVEVDRTEDSMVWWTGEVKKTKVSLIYMSSCEHGW